MDENNQPLPSGPSTLCFNKEEFMREGFHPENFVVECRRKVTLEVLRDDLRIYLKILQSAMIELINKDYADFVNLSSNLVGLDKAINSLRYPLGQLSDEVISVSSAMDEAITAVQEKVHQQQEIRQKKISLQRLMNIITLVEKIEKLLGIKHSPETETQYTSELSGQLIERVATEFNKLQFFVNKSRGLPLVEEIKPRIANITTTLQYSLEGSFIEGLDSGDPQILQQCLRTYATIDKMRDAEMLFRQHKVRPYMEEVISEEFIKECPDGLKGMYAAVLDFIPQHLAKLREVTNGTFESGQEIVRGYDFLVNSVWPEVVANIEARTPSIFAPGNPTVFHKKYKISMDFVSRLEHHCGSQASVKRLRDHPSYNTFMSKWSLPVYFQIRFQEIAGSVESALSSPFTAAPGESSFKLSATETVWACLHKCWEEQTYLQPLCHRFWKLTLQLVARYSSWVKEVTENELKKKVVTNGEVSQVKAPVSEPNITRAVTPPPPPAPLSMADIVHVIADCQMLATKLPEFFTNTVKPYIVELGLQNTGFLEANLSESQNSLRSTIPVFGEHVVQEMTTQCSSQLKFVNDIPRLFRKTNREVPTKPSNYMQQLLKPAHTFVDDHKTVLPDQCRIDWITQTVNNIATQYLSVTSDVLTSVKKMEESLKRLKKSKASSEKANVGMTDDDKIRHQLYLDVKDFGKQIEKLEISTETIKDFASLNDVVEHAKSGSSNST